MGDTPRPDDLKAAKAKETKRGKDKPPRVRKDTQRPRNFPLNQIPDKLGGLITHLGQMVGLRWPADGAVIAAHAPDLAQALADCARESTRMHWALYRACQANAWGSLASVGVSMALAILANHRPDLIAGLAPPDSEDDSDE